ESSWGVSNRVARRRDRFAREALDLGRETMRIRRGVDDRGAQAEQILLSGRELEIRESAALVTLPSLFERRLRLGQGFIAQRAELFMARQELLIERKQRRLRAHTRRVLFRAGLLPAHARFRNRPLVTIEDR